MMNWMNEERFVKIFGTIAITFLAVMIIVLGPKFAPEPITFDDNIEDIELTDEMVEAYVAICEYTFERD